MADQSLLAKEQFLTADSEKKQWRFGLSKFDVSLTKIHRVFKGRRVRFYVSSEGLRILSLKLKTHPVGWSDAHVDSHAAEHISVARIGSETRAIHSFKAHPVFTAEAQP
jgi:hypothetical protein